MHKKINLIVDTKQAFNTNRTPGNVVLNSNDFDSVKFCVNMTQDGAQLDLEGASVKLAIRKPDKTVTYQTGSVDFAGAGYCSFTLASQSYELPGLHTGEIMISYTSGEIVVSRSFPFIVETGILNDSAVESTNWFQDIHELTEDVNALKTEVDSVLIGTNEAAEAATGAATAAQTATAATETATQAATQATTAAATAASKATDALKKVEESSIKEIARNYREGKLIDIFKMADWPALVGVGSSDTTRVIKGKESLLLESKATGEQPFIRSSTLLKASGVRNVVLNLFVHNDPAELEGISVFFSNDTAFTNMLSYTFSSINFVKGWNRLLIPIERFTVSGTGTFENEIVRKQIRIIPAPGFLGKITFDSLLLDTAQQPNIIFTFDDNWKTQYTTAFAEMKKRGLKGTIGVNGINVGVTNYMNWSELEDVYLYGWDLANHTNEHYNLGLQNYDVQKKDISDGRQALNNRGLTRASNILFYPYGSYNETTLQILKELGITFARTIREQIESAPPINNQLLKIKNLLPVVTAADAKKSVDDAIKTGGTVIFLAHRFGTEDASNMFYDPAKFIELLDYVSLKNNESKINVLTISEWIKTF